MTREDANYYLKSSGFSDEQIDTIAKAYTEPCDDEYIKVPKKALKYRTAGMVAYNAEWLKNHFDIERAVILGCEYKEQEPKTGHWIPVSERLPEKYTYTLWCASSGYVRSDYFNGEFWKDAKKYCYEVIAWMPLPKPYEPQERSSKE